MNRISSAIVLATTAFIATVALPAYAQPPEYLEGAPTSNFTAPSVNGPTREQVKAQAVRRRSPDEYDGASRVAMGVQYPGKLYKHPTPSTLTRAEVRAEFDRAKASGELAALNSNDRYGLDATNASNAGGGVRLASHER